MDMKFMKAVESLHPEFEQLMGAAPYTPGAKLPMKGVYLFCEHGKPLYVGRSNNIPRRFHDHRRPSSGTNKAAFAVLLARRELGLTTDYRPGPKTRKNLEKDPDFIAAFRRAKDRVREMEFRAVEELEPIRQALLEIYCAVAACASFNDFENH
jgi:hypothetical protein